VGPHGESALVKTNAVKKIGRRSGKNEGQTWKVETWTMKKFLAMGEARVAIF